MTQRAWLARAGRGGEREQWALEHGFTGGGFQEVGDLSGARSWDDVVEAVRTALGGGNLSRIRSLAAQLWALRERMAVGDLVVMPLKGGPVIAIGRISGPYTYRDDPDPARRHVRPVEWVRIDVPRTAVKQDLLYSLGAFSTVCEVSRNDAAARIAALMSDGRDPGARSATTAAARTSTPENEDGELGDSSLIEIDQYAADRIASHVIETFAGHRMQDLVAAVLEAEGFTCKVAEDGPDQGVDILAGSGPLGLDEPRLVVQVKSEDRPVGVDVAQQLLGAISHHRADQGLLVAWGGITRPAEQLLKSQYFRVRVWNSQDLLAAVFRNYPKLSEEIRTDLPLKQVWVLVEESG